MYLSRDDILKAEDVVTKEVAVPEWGVDAKVRVRGMTGVERDEWEASNLERRGKRMVPNLANLRAKLITRCIVDDEGDRIFSEADADLLGAKSAAAINRIYEVAAQLSGITDEDLEELVEDFGKTPGSGSPSTSPGTSTKPGRSSSATRAVSS